MLLLVARFVHRMGVFQSKQCIDLRGRSRGFKKLPAMEFTTMEQLGGAVPITKGMHFRA